MDRIILILLAFFIGICLYYLVNDRCRCVNEVTGVNEGFSVGGVLNNPDTQCINPIKLCDHVPPVCNNVLQELCGEEKKRNYNDCMMCAGMHAVLLRGARCSNDNFEEYCSTSATPVCEEYPSLDDCYTEYSKNNNLINNNLYKLCCTGVKILMKIPDNEDANADYRDEDLNDYKWYTIHNCSMNSSMVLSNSDSIYGINVDTYDLEPSGDIELLGNICNLDNYTNLLYLNLESNKIDGNISSLQNLHNLEYLNLKYTNVSGNISSLSNLNNLETLYLSNTNVSGNISDLSNLSKLKALNFFGVLHITGNISDLSNLNNLETLVLSSTNISGNISSLQNLYNLEFLDLDNANVSGSISSLSGINKLRYISLNETNLLGSISNLSNSSGLEYLYMRNTNVSGDISDLNSFSILNSIDIYGTKISGNIKDLSTDRFKQLTWIVLPSDVSGNINGFNGLNSLESLNIGETKILGDISGLDLESIVYLNLPSSILGNISSLSRFTTLSNIIVKNTNMSGDISSLQNLDQLEYINLSNNKGSTNITGDISSLEDLLNKNLSTLDLSNNLKIKGTFNSYQKFLSKLQDSLNLSGTSVKMNP